MLVKHRRLSSVDLCGVMRVYAQSVGNMTWQKESAFTEDLQLFFECDNVFLATWVIHGALVSAVRLEPYRDGFLFTCLETAPEHRRNGYAAALLRAVMAETSGVYYAHVDKKNKVSLHLHENLGFYVIMDHAVHVDGSVFSNSFTLKR